MNTEPSNDSPPAASAAGPANSSDSSSCTCRPITDLLGESVVGSREPCAVHPEPGFEIRLLEPIRISQVYLTFKLADDFEETERRTRIPVLDEHGEKIAVIAPGRIADTPAKGSGGAEPVEQEGSET